MKRKSKQKKQRMLTTNCFDNKKYKKKQVPNPYGNHFGPKPNTVSVKCWAFQ